MRMSMAIAAAIAAVTAVPAMAQDDATDGGARVSVAVTGGTLGVGPEVGVRIADHFGVRGNATFLGFSGDYDSDDVTYDGKLKLKSFGVMADLIRSAAIFACRRGHGSTATAST